MPRSIALLLPLATSLALAALAFEPGAAHAEDVIGFGSAGADGADGAAGDPGAPGQGGGAGQSVTSVADAPGEANRAVAAGGVGGAGGAGGDGLPDGADGGAGGSGGAGGDATATASSSITATAVAAGGRGGLGGAGGAATGAGLPGAPGADGPAGSNEATAIGQRAADGLVSASAEARGFADVTARATADHDGDLRETDASARATTTGPGAAIAEATARSGLGGFGQPIDFQNGSASADAFASNAGPEDVRAAAIAYGGLGSTGTAASASATAQGESSGGGDVTVEAAVFFFSIRQSGGDLTLHDAVSGSTSGRLELKQLLKFGTPDPLQAGSAGGDGVVSLVASNPGGGDLSLDVEVQAGRGDFFGAPAGDAVVGDVIGTSTHGAGVEVAVRAFGGTSLGGTGGDAILENRRPGEPVTPARVFGESNGGDVTVRGEFWGGSGESVNSQAVVSDGGSAILDNAVGGETTGNLALEQVARAGGGGFPQFSGFSTGSSGEAQSLLAKETHSESLELWSRAEATFGVEAPIGTTVATAEGVNTGGSAQATAHADGAWTREGEDGGDAVAIASARTTADGADVVVGVDRSAVPPNVPFFFYGARGGSNGGSIFGTAPQLGNGGAGTSRSTGIAEGDALVTVFDRAAGGRGGFDSSRAILAGDGGAASSSATASGGGSSAVSARAEAMGGRAGATTIDTGLGGEATATATATGLGPVESWASAVGGDSAGSAVLGGGQAGGGLAQASAEGSSGFARADALGGLGRGPQFRVASEALVGSRSDVAAQATYATALADAPSDPTLEGLAFATGEPLGDDVDRALAGNAGLAALFAADPGAAMPGLALWQGSGRGAGEAPVELSTEIDIILDEDFDPTRKLVLAAFDVTSVGGDFVSLSFGIDVNGAAIGDDESFGDAAAAAAFFQDRVFDLGLGLVGGDEVRVRLALTIGGESSFGSGLAYGTVVPEPGTGLLLGFGLLLLPARGAARRR